jgi:hypothetical protein
MDAPYLVSERNYQMSFIRLCTFIVGFGLVACDGREAPKTPLGASTSAASGITGDARIALDSGNILFRAKNYDAALAQYERAAGLAPAEAAPLLGIMMVADVKKDQGLADETLLRMKQLNPELADTAAVSAHAKAMQQHPPVGSSKKLPPEHPPLGGARQPPPGPASGSIRN